MGGLGSGRLESFHNKSVTSDFYKLKISQLVSDGELKSNHYDSGTWEWATEECGKRYIERSMDYIINTVSYIPYLELEYDNTKSQETFNYKIRFTTTTPNYGGKRWWFICPIRGCNKRVGILYLGKKYFACRKCYNITYQSQQESLVFRMIHQARKINRELGGYGYPDEDINKPKGMHWKTFRKKKKRMKSYYKIYVALVKEKFGSACIDFLDIF